MSTPALVKAADLKRMENEFAIGKTGWIYFVTNPQAETVKIGFSVDLSRRIEVLQTGNHIRLLPYSGFRSVRHVEQIIQHMFAPVSLEGEWFRHTKELDELIECFEEKSDECDDQTLSPDDVLAALDDWHNSYGRGRSADCGNNVDNAP